ncbi:hypothetical protein LWI29_008134 [Acer saccharum]|uniref:Uncharacterized protein n=1 Tax=Acer saccharum TaxID=4024 RepID=A0AA39RPH7_ACESA|nr:hypothetical protein LWI29_008134 [Acer saccharum]
MRVHGNRSVYDRILGEKKHRRWFYHNKQKLPSPKLSRYIPFAIYAVHLSGKTILRDSFYVDSSTFFRSLFIGRYVKSQPTLRSKRDNFGYL